MGFSALPAYVHRTFSNICSQTCQSAILLHANMTNIANMPRTWFEHFEHTFTRTYVLEHARTCILYMASAWLGKVIMKPSWSWHTYTHTLYCRLGHTHKLQTCNALPQRQHSFQYTIFFGPVAATSHNEIAALPKPIDEHSSNMARTCLEHGMAHAAPLWGRLSALFCRSTVTRFEAF